MYRLKHKLNNGPRVNNNNTVIIDSSQRVPTNLLIFFTYLLSRCVRALR
jgi:hypothetical protein